MFCPPLSVTVGLHVREHLVEMREVESGDDAAQAGDGSGQARVLAFDRRECLAQAAGIADLGEAPQVLQPVRQGGRASQRRGLPAS